MSCQVIAINSGILTIWSCSSARTNGEKSKAKASKSVYIILWKDIQDNKWQHKIVYKLVTRNINFISYSKTHNIVNKHNWGPRHNSSFKIVRCHLLQVWLNSDQLHVIHWTTTIVVLTQPVQAWLFNNYWFLKLESAVLKCKKNIRR